MYAPRATCGVGVGAGVVASDEAGLDDGDTAVVDVVDEGDEVAGRADGVSVPPALLTAMATNTSVTSVAKIDDVTTRRDMFSISVKLIRTAISDGRRATGPTALFQARP